MILLAFVLVSARLLHCYETVQNLMFSRLNNITLYSLDLSSLNKRDLLCSVQKGVCFTFFFIRGMIR